MANFQANRAKQGKNEFLFGVLWCFLGVLGDNNGQNLNIFLKARKENGLKSGQLCLPFIVSTGVGVQALCGSGPAGTLAVVLWWCVALLYCFAPCTLA